MNLSGKAVLTFLSYYHLTYQDLLVIHDDMDLPLGRIRIRGQGRSGGHRGIESIIQCLGTSQFPRLRIGIGRPCGQQEPKEYVLKEFSEEEQTIVAKVIETTVQCVEVILDEGILTAMNRFNRLDAVG